MHSRVAALCMQTSSCLSPAPLCMPNKHRMACLQEVLPFLVATLDCQVRPVAPNMFTQQEKAAVAGLVGVLIAYSLTFMLDTAAEAELGQLPPSCAGRAVPVHPAVHRLCLFPVSGRGRPQFLTSMQGHLQCFRSSPLLISGEQRHSGQMWQLTSGSSCPPVPVVVRPYILQCTNCTLSG